MLRMQENDTYGRVKRGWLYWLMNSTLVNLKGVVLYEIFYFRFFHEQVSPGPQSIPLELFSIFTEIRGDIRNCMFIAVVNDTSCSPVKTSPAINYCWCLWHWRFHLVPDSHCYMTSAVSFSCVTTTPAIIYQGDIRIYSRIFVTFEMSMQVHGGN